MQKHTLLDSAIFSLVIVYIPVYCARANHHLAHALRSMAVVFGCATNSWTAITLLEEAVLAR